MNLPRVYTCSQFWTPLPPPSPYHPSGSSQCTSPKHPVSCIKPRLAIRFLYDIILVSMQFSKSFFFFNGDVQLCALDTRCAKWLWARLPCRDLLQEGGAGLFRVWAQAHWSNAGRLLRQTHLCSPRTHAILNQEKNRASAHATKLGCPAPRFRAGNSNPLCRNKIPANGSLQASETRWSTNEKVRPYHLDAILFSPRNPSGLCLWHWDLPKYCQSLQSR